MLKFIFSFFILLFFNACGVDTASSAKVVEEPSVEIPTDSDLIVFDSIDSNPIVTTSVDTNDSNVSDGEDGSVIPDVPTVNPSTSEFDVEGAIADPNACNISSYSMVGDASYGGELNGENGSASAIADGKGLVIRSEYLSQDFETTWVYLYYKSAPSALDLDLQGVTSYTMDDVFYISYDLAWADKSISGIDNIIYVRSDKTTKPSCYRLTLDSIDGSEIDVQKVYRTL